MTFGGLPESAGMRSMKVYEPNAHTGLQSLIRSW